MNRRPKATIRYGVTTVALALMVGVGFLFAGCAGAGEGASSGPYNLGNDVQFGDFSSYSDGEAHWIAIEVSSDTTITSLSMIGKRFSGSAATPIRMSVYTNDGSGYADELVVGSSVQSLTFEVEDTAVSAGTYWVGFNADVDVSVSADRSLSAKDGCFTGSGIATASAWPDNVSPSRSTNADNNLNVYMTVQD